MTLLTSYNRDIRRGNKMRRFDTNETYRFSAEKFKAQESISSCVMMADIINYCDGKIVEVQNSIGGIIEGENRNYKIVPKWCVEEGIN